MKKSYSNNQKTMKKEAVTNSKAKRTQKKQKEAQMRKEQEANARRKVNSSWDRIAKTRRYRKAAAADSCLMISLMIEDELMDGILLNLNERNNSKPYSVKMRLLRRIVEKRQAQANHRKNGRTNDLLTTHLSIECTSTCMNRIKRRQQAC